MDVYCCATYYHLIISLMHMSSNKKSLNNENMLYLTTHDDKQYQNFKKIVNKLREIDAVDYIFIRKRHRLREKLFIENAIDILQYKKLNSMIEDGIFYNFIWNPYSLYTPSNYLFKKCNESIFFEESATSYIYTKPSNINLFIKKNLYKIKIDFYNDEKLKDIYISNPEKYPIHLKKKIKKFDFDNLCKQVKKNELEQICSVFLSENQIEKLHNLQFSSNAISIILTQPLSEDGFISEVDKVRIYKKIVNENKDQNFVIKRHPREKTIYNINGILELDGEFPSELFKLIGIKFKKAIGICTSAIHYIDANEKINLDENFLKKHS